MFYATVIICTIATQMCSVLEDTRGPYDTLDECKARLVQMRQAVVQQFQRFGPQPIEGTVFCADKPYDELKKENEERKKDRGQAV